MPALPIAVISHRAALRLQSGHVWVYRSDLQSLEDTAPGSLVQITDSRGRIYGTAISSSTSEIALRLYSRDQLDQQRFLNAIEQRACTAAERRTPNFVNGTDSARLIFSEADELPGIIADRYNDIIVLQLNAQGVAQDSVREHLVRGLTSAATPTPIRAIFERQDARIRELETLAPIPGSPLYLAPNAGSNTSTTFHLNGIAFHYDVASGQKTGAFLDQRENYAAAAHHAASSALVSGARSALDICTYQGGFALHLAKVCDSVTGVDASRAALEVAEQNAIANHLEVDWLEADVFALLRDFAAAGQQYSTIVLDPPAFAKSKRATEGALRGYKEMNLRALEMLAPGGVLVTCSCSHHVSLADFRAMLAAAAADANRRVTLLETRTAALDHPVVLTIPETYYLKCLICRVD